MLPISELLSHFLLSLSSAPSRTCAGFVEARAVRGTPRVRPAAPPTCSPVSVRRNKQGSASVRRPVRLSLVSTSCPIAGCNTLIVIC